MILTIAFGIILAFVLLAFARVILLGIGLVTLIVAAVVLAVWVGPWVIAAAAVLGMLYAGSKGRL